MTETRDYDFGPLLITLALYLAMFILKHNLFSQKTMSVKLPITDSGRIRKRDNKLWLRDKRRAELYDFNRIPCPCALHRGKGRTFLIAEVERHLLRHGRSPECRIWRGPSTPDSSDEEWELHDSLPSVEHSHRIQERDSGLEMRQMMQDMYQQVRAFEETEERLDNITMEAMETVDNITGINTDWGEEAVSHRGQDLNEGDDATTENGEQSNPPTCTGETSRDGGRHDEGGEGGPGSPDHRDHRYLDSTGVEEERVRDVKALEDAMEILYRGSKHSKLGATVMIVNLVATHSGITEKAADDILATLKCLLPDENCLPDSMYKAKTLTKRLGLDFRNIDGCPRGCVLFDDDRTKELDRCPVCEAPRYKDMMNRIRPLKVLRFFPPTPRLKRFFRIPVLSKLMRWHCEHLSSDGKVRYPADAEAWKHLDNMDPTVFDTQGFGSKPQDVRLQLSCDGICPFKLHKSTWSAWPVLLSILNLPPWLVTKKYFTILALLIPGRSQVPFEFFDVWMRPLVEELKVLWDGVPAYDVTEREGRKVFQLRAAVLYTTHDFPGYGTVSGCSHQGYVACPPCGDQLRGKYAFESKKITYRDARRWVSPEHVIRSSQYDHLFDGNPEDRERPIPKTPAQQKAALEEYQAYLARPQRGRSSGGSRSSRGRRGVALDPSKVHGVKRGSILYELPYWEVRRLLH